MYKQDLKLNNPRGVDMPKRPTNEPTNLYIADCMNLKRN